MSYVKVTRGKHLFGGVYETYANGELIGVTKQGRWNPWWLPEDEAAQAEGMGNDRPSAGGVLLGAGLLAGVFAAYMVAQMFSEQRR
jgi:hypothetical protein